MASTKLSQQIVTKQMGLPVQCGTNAPSDRQTIGGKLTVKYSSTSLLMMINTVLSCMTRRNAFIAVLVVAFASIASSGTTAWAWDNVVHSELVVETPSSSVPRVVDGRVWAIAQWGDLVVVGGQFSAVRVAGGQRIARSNVFAFWRNTGAIDRRFDATVNGTVRSIAVDPNGRGIFIGGQFNRVNGESRRGLVFLNRDGQRVRNWRGRPNGPVADLAVRGNTLYVGGRFSRINGQQKAIFGTISVSDGQLTSESDIVFSDPRYPQFRGVLEVRRFEISPDERRLIVLGNFQQADGRTRDQIAVLDVASSPDRVADWSTNWFDQPCNGSRTIWPYFVRDVSISPDGSYFAVATVGGPQEPLPHPCDMVARFELGNGLNQSPTWANYSGGDSVLSVEISGPIVYVGGHFRWMNNEFGQNRAGPGAIARGTLAALNPSNGAVLDWNPGRMPRGQGVLVMESAPDGLWLGHDTGFVNGVYSPRLTHLALPNALALNFQIPARQRPGQIAVAGSVNSEDPITEASVSLTDTNGRFLHPDGEFREEPATLDVMITGLGTNFTDIFSETWPLDVGRYTVHITVTDSNGKTATQSTDIFISEQ